jgi:hypothetical protein
MYLLPFEAITVSTHLDKEEIWETISTGYFSEDG